MRVRVSQLWVAAHAPPGKAKLFNVSKSYTLNIRMSARTSRRSEQPRVDDGGLLINPYKHQDVLALAWASEPTVDSLGNVRYASVRVGEGDKATVISVGDRVYLTPESDRTKTPCEIATIQWLGPCDFDPFGMLVQWFWRPGMVKNLHTLPGPDKPVDREIFFSVDESVQSIEAIER